MRVGIRLAALSLTLAGCSALSPPTPPSGPQPTPERAVPPRFEQLADGSQRMFPTSARVQPGVVYRFQLFTHCGLDSSFPDFDGSLWDIESSHRDGLTDPADNGTIVLVSANEAVYTSESGRQLRLVRATGPRIVPICY